MVTSVQYFLSGTMIPNENIPEQLLVLALKANVSKLEQVLNLTPVPT